MVGHRGRMSEIVEDDADGDAVVIGEFAHEVEDLRLVAQVEVIRRFVEQQHTGVLGQAGRQPDTLQLAAGELIDGPIGHPIGAGQLERTGDGRPIGIGESGEASAVRVAAVGDDLADADAGRMRTGLGQERDDAGEFLGAESARGRLRTIGADDHVTGGDRMETGQGPQDRRLARAVGTQQRRHRPRGDGHAHVVDDRSPVVAESEVGGSQSSGVHKCLA